MPDEIAFDDGTPVSDWVLERGLADPSDRLELTQLDGGVSSLVVVVRGGDREMVLKQPLPRLQVADEWLADTARVLTEASALRAMALASPGAAPALIDLDEQRRVIAIELIDAESDWRRRLLDHGPHTSDVEIARRLGAVLASWRTIDVTTPAMTPVDSAAESFAQLRTRPYHRTVAARVPDVAEAMLTLADELDGATASPGRSFVHGDYSPKNVLVHARTAGVWVLDFEVAHAGDPVFDLAFMSSHLLCKAVHLDAFEAMAGCLAAFYAGYGDEEVLARDGARLTRHTGGLLLARVHGRSPNGYLSPASRERVERLGRQMLTDDIEPTIEALIGALRRNLA